MTRPLSALAVCLLFPLSAAAQSGPPPAPPTVTRERALTLNDYAVNPDVTGRTPGRAPGRNWFADGLLHAASEIVGRIHGVSGEDGWTKWYKLKGVFGTSFLQDTHQILLLAYMRRQLNEKNLFNPYWDNKVAFYDGNAKPPAWTKFYRTPDGKWNNPKDPFEGAALTRFAFNTDPSKSAAETTSLMDPNPRKISEVLLKRENGDQKTVPFLNMLAAAWIQFNVHDWVAHGSDRTKWITIPLPPDDPARALGQTTMTVPVTAADPTRGPLDAGKRDTFINEVTHWWDGSQIYGSDEATSIRLRTDPATGQVLADGKLYVDPATGRIATDPVTGQPVTGFSQNWWVGLSLMHNTFVAEHNHIAGELRRQHPDWTSDQIYNTARLINAAIIAKIHTVEWTPAILPNRTLNKAMHANWYGLVEHSLKTFFGFKPKTRSWLDVANAELGGVVGNRTDKHGRPQALSDIFVSVYRMHELMPDYVNVKSIDGAPVASVPINETRLAKAEDLVSTVGVASLLNSFGTQKPGQLVLNNVPAAVRELSVPGQPVFDLAAIDILRDRERGVPRYNEARRQLGLTPIKSFDALTDDPEQVRRLREVYGTNPLTGKDNVEAIDLHVGTMAESHRPTNFGFGETLFQVFILNATRRLQSDRFFTTDYNKETYTKWGLEHIDNSTFKDVLLRHNPSLANTGLAKVNNAFEPWDTSAADLKNPAYHPLDQYRK